MAMRSFTELAGFWLSSLATISPTQPSVTRFKRTSGVLPIRSNTSFAILGRSACNLVKKGETCPDIAGARKDSTPTSRVMNNTEIRNGSIFIRQSVGLSRCWPTLLRVILKFSS